MSTITQPHYLSSLICVIGGNRWIWLWKLVDLRLRQLAMLTLRLQPFCRGLGFQKRLSF